MLFSVRVSYLLAVLLELSGSFRRGTSLLFFYFFRRYIPIISLAGYHIPDPSSVSVLPVVKKTVTVSTQWCVPMHQVYSAVLLMNRKHPAFFKVPHVGAEPFRN